MADEFTKYDELFGTAPVSDDFKKYDDLFGTAPANIEDDFSNYDEMFGTSPVETPETVVSEIEPQVQQGIQPDISPGQKPETPIEKPKTRQQKNIDILAEALSKETDPEKQDSIRDLLSQHGAEPEFIESIIPRVGEFAPVRILGETEAKEKGKTTDIIPTRPGVPSTPLGGTVVGVSESIPFAEPTGQDIEQIKAEQPGSVVAGRLLGETVQAVAGGSGALKLLAKTAVSKSPLLLNTLARVIPATGIRGAHSAEDLLRGKAELKDALFNTLVESGGGAAFSMIPEIIMPPGVAQLIAQPLADVMYQAGVDALRGGESRENVFTPEWFKSQIPTIATSLGFAINDVGDKTFIARQAGMRAEIAGIGKPKPEPLPVPTQKTMTSETERLLQEADLAKEELAQSLRTKQRKLKEAPVRGLTSELKQLQAIKEDFESTGLPATKKGFQDYWKETVGERLSREEAGSKMKQILGSTEKETITGVKEPIIPETPKVPKKIIEPPGEYISPVTTKKEVVAPEVKTPEQKFQKKVVPEVTTEKISPEQQKLKDVGRKVPEAEIKKTEPKLPKEDVTPESNQPDPKETIPIDKVPGQKKGDPEYTRRRGFASKSGAVGGGKQIKPKFKDLEAAEMQKIFEQGDRAVKDKFGFNTERFIDKQLSRFLDVGAPWKRKILKNNGGKQVVIASDLSRGASGEANRIYETAEKEIYDNIPHAEEEVFSHFIQAKRSVEVLRLKGSDFKTPGGDKNAKWLAELKKENPETYNRLEKGAEKYWSHISKTTLNEYVDEGIMTRKLADQLLKEQAHYSPRKFIQHIDPETPSSFDSQGNLITVRDSGLKRLDEGSEQALINNPRLLLAQTKMASQSRIFKNRANKELYNFTQSNPENSLGIKIEEPGQKRVPAGMTRVSAMIDGRSKDMLMPTEIAQYWVTQESKISQDMGKFINVMSGSALLKPMATGLNPGFALSNLPRDIMHSWFVTEEYSPILPIAWAQQGLDIAKVLPDVIRRKGRVIDYSKEGGSLDLLTQQGQLARKPWETQSPLRESIHQIQKFLGWAGETSELLTRIALRERALKNKRSAKEATWVARNYIDFAQGGSWSKVADKAVPYLNAGIQGTRGVFRAFKEQKGVAVFKAAQIVSVGMALAYWNRRQNEEAWDSISEREKTGKFIITTPFTRKDKDGNKRYIYFAIPKDQGQRLFATIGEEMAEMVQTGNMNFEKLKKSATDLIPVDVGVSIPSMSAFWGYVYNKDFWRNEDIWRGRKGVSPKKEIYNETPKAWVAWGSATSLSPERSRRAFNKLVPMNAYTHILEGATSQMIGALSDKEKEVIQKPFLSKLAESPISRKIIRETWPRSKKTEELLEKADKFQIETHSESGKQLPLDELSRKVKKAERDSNDKKITNDLNFDFLATVAIVGNQDTKSNLQKELANLKDTDIAEYKRIKNRLKRKFGKSYRTLIRKD